MPKNTLNLYLNDHLAGSVAVLELIPKLELASVPPEAAQEFRRLHDDILDDRKALESLMASLNVTQSSVRKALAWISEKAAAIKLTPTGPDADFRLLEACDALSIAIEGKKLMWQALKAAAAVSPELGGPDYMELIRRAEDQRQRVESIRLRAAVSAFGSTAG